MAADPTQLAEYWGLLPAADGWREWFAWRPVKACGRWRWLTWVQRRLDIEWAKSNPEDYDDTPMVKGWKYAAGRAHDYPDDDGIPTHFHTYTCRSCGARFGI